MRRPPPLSQFVQYPVTSGTALLAIGVTLAGWGGYDISPLTSWVQIRQGELWRLVTSILPHGNILHLAFNLYWLWVFGTLVESVFGHILTLFLLVLFAAGSMSAEYGILHGGIGLSGVGYGLFGMTWVLSRRDHRFEGAVDANTIGMFVAWFFLCIGMTVTGAMPVANIAHGVGGVLGLLSGWAIISRGVTRLLAGATITLLIGLSLASATIGRGRVNFSDDGNGEAYLAYRALEANEDERARHWGEEAVRIQPGHAGAWFNLGITYDRLQKPNEAKSAYARAAALDPDNLKYRAAADAAN